MKKTPLLLALLVLLPYVAAECAITGSWSAVAYNAGQTMEFEGDISPSSGFIHGYIENSVGDKIAVLATRQISSDFLVRINTNKTYLNGTYTAHFFYDAYANTTLCGKSIVKSTTLRGNNSKGDLVLNIVLSQGYPNQTVNVTGAPVETSLGTITTTLRGVGVKGLMPSFRLNGTQLVAGQGIGNINLQLTQCQQNEDILSSYQRVGSFLNSNFTNMVQYEQEKVRLQGEIDQTQFLLGNMTGERDKSIEETKKWISIAGGKWDVWFAVLMIIICSFLAVLAKDRFINNFSQGAAPRPVAVSGRVPHKEDDKRSVLLARLQR
jgi:hypothetical protein